jgi:hypothetical protein
VQFISVNLVEGSTIAVIEPTQSVFRWGALGPYGAARRGHKTPHWRLNLSNTLAPPAPPVSGIVLWTRLPLVGPARRE